MLSMLVLVQLVGSLFLFGFLLMTRRVTVLLFLAHSNEHLLKRTHLVSSVHSTSTAVAAKGMDGLQWTQRLCPRGQHDPHAGNS